MGDFDSIVLSPSRKPATPPGAKVVALCFHDEEYPELPNAAEAVAQFFQNPARQASTTGVIDNNSKVQCVPYGQTAWHTGAGDPWNYMIEGYEHSGYASQTREQWLDGYGRDMLELSAEHFAKRCRALGIPPRKISPAQLKAAIQANNPSIGGIVGHYDITIAAGVYGGHTDPGPNFPWDYYIVRVQAHYNGTPDQEDEMKAQPAVRFPDGTMYAYMGDHWAYIRSGAHLADLQQAGIVSLDAPTNLPGSKEANDHWERWPVVGGPAPRDAIQ